MHISASDVHLMHFFVLLAASDMLSHRQKLIMLADASNLGWRVVNKYESNPLADDSGDERRIFKAEAWAARKMKAERGRRGRGRSTPYPRGGSRAVVSPKPDYPARQVPVGSSVRSELCFGCGKPGHWKNECPGNGSNNKMNTIFEVFCKGTLLGIDVSDVSGKPESSPSPAEGLHSHSPAPERRLR